jgi:transcriptional regulator with XRE-family HTH domain
MTPDERSRQALAETLVQVRIEHGMSLEAVAAAAAIDVQRLIDVEAGKALPTEAELQSLSDAYGVDVPKLFGARYPRLQDYA